MSQFKKLSFLAYLSEMINSSVDKLAVSLVASLISELVIPRPLLLTICSIVEYQRSVPGSLNEKNMIALHHIIQKILLLIDTLTCSPTQAIVTSFN